MFPFPPLNTVSRVGMTGFLLVGMLVVAVIEIANWQEARLLSRLSYQLYDFYCKSFKTAQVSPQVVIVDIDEISLQLMGQWPWPQV